MIGKDARDYTEEDLLGLQKTRLDYALRLAGEGFHFAPAKLGCTHGEIGWPRDATADRERIKAWVDAGKQLVMVAKFGKCAVLDFDDFEACKELGFDEQWLRGMLRVDTPSGPGHFHCYLPWSPALDAFPKDAAKADAFDANGNLVAELKLNNSTVAAPGSLRFDPEGKNCEGAYVPVSEQGAEPCPDAPAVSAWFRARGKRAEHKGKPEFAGKKEPWEFIYYAPNFKAEFLKYHLCSGLDPDDGEGEGWVDGSFHLVVDECPLCDREARKNTTLAAAVSKFIFSGTGYGFVCHACGTSGRKEFEEKMAGAHPGWEPWGMRIYRHENTAFLFKDGADAGLEVEMLDTGEGQGAESPAAAEAIAALTEGFTYQPTETGNGERLVRKHGRLIRWVPEINAWMVWGKSGWRQDTDGKLMRMTKRVIDEIREEAFASWTDAFPDEARGALATLKEARQRHVGREEIISAKTALKEAYGNGAIDKEREAETKALLRHAKDSGKGAARKAMIMSAGFEKGILSNLDGWDSDGWLLNVQNGVIDLGTQAFRERTQADLCMKQSPVAYDPRAGCPRWESAMLKWMCGDRELVRYLQAALGLTLTSDTSQQCLFFNEGGGENGKDTMFTTVGDNILGAYCKDAAISTFVETRFGHSELRSDLASLAGAVRMVTVSETQDGHHLDEAIVKKATGCSPVTCRQLYGRYFTYRPQYKLWIMSNYPVVIKGTDWAIWRRVKRIPWNRSFKDDPRKDPDFTEKLRAEAPGILNWMLAGLAQYLENGKRLPECKAVKDATEQYRQDMDIVGRFARERLEFRPTAAALGKRIYREYVGWCKENGTPPMSGRRFFADFRKRNPRPSEKDTNQGQLFIGVEVRLDPSPPGPEDV